MPDWSSALIDQVFVYRSGRSEENGIFPGNYNAVLRDEEAIFGIFQKIFKKSPWFIIGNNAADKDVSQTVSGYFNQNQDGADALAEVVQHWSQTAFEMPDASAWWLFFSVKDLLLDDELTDAIAILKLDVPQTFLHFYREENQLNITGLEGFRSEDISSAVLVCQIREQGGYKTKILEKKEGLPDFWRDQFLKLQPVDEALQQTQLYMNLSRKFVQGDAKGLMDVDKSTQADMLHKSVQFFQNNDHFDIDTFSESVFPTEEQREGFKKYREVKAEEQMLPFADEFDIAHDAVKKQVGKFRSVIKLDKNFHIYLHGDQTRVERGFDADLGKSYYKLYFDQES